MSTQSEDSFDTMEHEDSFDTMEHDDFFDNLIKNYNSIEHTCIEDREDSSIEDEEFSKIERDRMIQEFKALDLNLPSNLDDLSLDEIREKYYEIRSRLSSQNKIYSSKETAGYQSLSDLQKELDESYAQYTKEKRDQDTQMCCRCLIALLWIMEHCLDQETQEQKSAPDPRTWPPVPCDLTSMMNEIILSFERIKEKASSLTELDGIEISKIVYPEELDSTIQKFKKIQSWDDLNSIYLPKPFAQDKGYHPGIDFSVYSKPFTLFVQVMMFSILCGAMSHI